MKINMVANIIAQMYLAIIGIIATPYLVKILGMDAYGLVTFFSTMQIVFSLIDAGLSGAASRECALYRSGGINKITFEKILAEVENFFILISLTILILMSILIHGATAPWFQSNVLTGKDIEIAMFLMLIVAATRFISGLYRSILVGYESQVWLSTLNICMATARFVIIIPYLEYVNGTINDYFIFQMTVSIGEIFLLKYKSMSVTKIKFKIYSIKFKSTDIRKLIRPSMHLSLLSIFWAIITQTDKLVMSKNLNLTDFAKFSMPTMLASGMLLISPPITSAAMPKMVQEYVKGDKNKFFELYRNVTKIISIILIPVLFSLTLYSREILTFWLNNNDIATNKSYLLEQYSIGNALLIYSSLVFLLQYAQGDLKKNVKYTLIFVALQVPVMMMVGYMYGDKYIGYVWIVLNIINIIYGTKKIHDSNDFGLHVLWIKFGILPFVIINAVVFLLFKNVNILFESVINSLIVMVLSGVISIAFGALFYKVVKK